MAHIPTMPSDFLHLVVMLCRHLPERELEATIDYHLYGPGWTGGATDLEDQVLRNTLHVAYELTYSTTSFLGLPDTLDDLEDGEAEDG
ncbi:MAG TPA: hypothetical protein VGR26_07440 [Acidimicrobiales bacterium]|nr:hypothetical protein [Acidimicrobiales bacterium]